MNPTLLNHFGSPYDLAEYEKLAGLHDRNKLALRVTWINHCRAIAAEDCPKNKSGTPLVTDVDLMLLSEDKRAEALCRTLKL